jgi:hypothetical protein
VGECQPTVLAADVWVVDADRAATPDNDGAEREQMHRTRVRAADDVELGQAGQRWRTTGSVDLEQHAFDQRWMTQQRVGRHRYAGDRQRPVGRLGQNRGEELCGDVAQGGAGGGADQDVGSGSAARGDDTEAELHVVSVPGCPDDGL